MSWRPDCEPKLVPLPVGLVRCRAETPMTAGPIPALGRRDGEHFLARVDAMTGGRVAA